tara:strand:- start:4033 stop:4737 length:705 start_codon:yes stop_codon:yes gene_type:complete
MADKLSSTLEQAVIFDLDGTLVDTLPDLQHALNRVLKEEGLELLETAETRLMIGGGARNLIDLAFQRRLFKANQELIEDSFDRFVEYYRSETTARSNVFPGVIEFLLTLKNKGVGMGICTNKPQDLAEKVLEELEIRHFFGEAVIGGDALASKKPDPAHLLAVIDKAGGIRENSFMIGDSETDVGAARNANIPIVVVDFGYTKLKPEELGADKIISSFFEALAALKSLGFRFSH